MAEIFGVISGAVGTAGVAVQFAESIRKICIFCKDIRDAPDQLRRATDELQLLSRILDSMAAQLQRNFLAYDGHASLPVILDSCRQGQEEMSTLLNDLQKNISKKRGQVRLVLKSTEIKKHLDRIERAKSALLISQNIYNGHLVQQGFGFVSTRIDQLEQQGLSSVAMRFDRLEELFIASMRPISTETHMNGSLKNDQSRAVWIADKEEDAHSDTSMVRTTPLRRRKLARCVGIKFQPLPWLWTQTWDLAVRQACEGWDFSFRTYRTISGKHPFFQACLVADVSGIQRMLSARTAFPSDRDERGLTALHYLAKSFASNSGGGYVSQADSDNDKFAKAASILISEGADVNAVNDFNFLPLYLLGSRFYGFIRSATPHDVSEWDKRYEDCSAEVNLARALSYSLDFGIEEADTARLIRWFHHAAPETIKLLQGRMYSPWTEVPFPVRVNRLIATRMFRCEFDSFLAWLGIDDTEVLWSSCTPKTRDRLLMLVFESLFRLEAGAYVDSVKKWHELILGYKPFVQEFIPNRRSDCCDIHKQLLWHYACHTDRSSPFPSQLNSLQRSLTFLVTELYALGVDLAEFGDVESGKWQIQDESGNYDVDALICDRDGNIGGEYHMIGFDYGPEIEDWRAWVSTPFDEWAGEFWERIENPREKGRKIPGAFPDSDYDSDEYEDDYEDEDKDKDEDEDEDEG